MSEHDRPLVGLDELARMLEAHEGPSDPRMRPPQPGSGRRWTLAVAAGALAVGAGTGFALASTAAPTADARGDTEGFGFLPARGWNVMQSGSLDRDGVARAVAANVPIDPRDSLAGEPRNTLHSLPPRGVLLSVTFSARGDPTADVSFPVRTLPLEISGERNDPGKYRLRAGINGTNVDAGIFFGRPEPTAKMLAVAQRQLNGLAVAADRVTIFARPTVIGEEPVSVYGSVDSGRAGEEVTIQAKDCGSSFFRAFAGATTQDGGGWSTVIFTRINTTLRAVWNDAASRQVTVRFRTPIHLQRTRRGAGFRVGVIGVRKSFWHKRVLVQRRRDGRWTTVKTVVLTAPGYTEFSLSVPKGTLLRAVMPLSQAKPCYLGGVSRTLRT